VYKSLLKKSILLFIVIIPFFSISQSSFSNSHKGHRPPINLDKVSPNAFEKGRLELKLYPRYFKHIFQIQKNASGTIQFNIPAVDDLLIQYGVDKANRMFTTILKNEELKSLHEGYGFHLWVELQFPLLVDVKQIAKALFNTGVFEVVEPIYKAQLIGATPPPPPFIPNDPILSLQWNLKNTGQAGGTIGKDISMIDAWGITTGSPDVVVSVHDNAISFSHPELGPNEAVGKSFNFIDNNDTLTLNSGHGSHCAGIIAAVNNNNVGMSGIAGGDGTTNSGIRLMSCEIFGPHGTGGGLAESIVYAADKGVPISNHSWGYSEPDVYDLAVLDAIDYFCDNGGGNVLKGGLPIFAAGNNGKNWRIFPGGYDRVVCVAATNNKDIKSNYSNFGDWVDISAPGGEGYLGGGIYSTENTSYSANSGTSFAAPHVVGVAALVASVLKGKASANDVREILLSTVDNNYVENPYYKGQIGTGRLNAYAALKKATYLLQNTPINTITNFKSTETCNTIELNWNNPSNSTVIIAFNAASNLGSLVDSKSYLLNDTIMGGGTIVYKGIGNSFVFNKINELSQYSFKLWVVNTSNQYSFSKTTEILCKPTIIGVGDSVLIQNFNSPPSFPTKIWNVTNKKYDLTGWYHTANDTAYTGAGDSYSMCMYNYQYNTLLGAVDTFSGPSVMVKSADSVILSFWHAYKFVDKQLPYSDTFEVVVSADCGKTYSSVWKKGGKDLTTVSDTKDSTFYPFTIDKWKKETINLSSFNTAEKLIIGFRGYNGKGNNLFFDNINVAVRYNNDASITGMVSPKKYECQSTIAPQVLLKNTGNNTINTCKIGYQIDQLPLQNIVIVSSIKKDSILLVNLPNQTFTTGLHTIKVYSFSPNNTIDKFGLNDTLSYSFTMLPKNNLPANEGFEGNINAPISWEVQQEPIDSLYWEKTNTAASHSNNSILIKNYQYVGTNQVDDLLSDVYKIPYPTDSLFLFFDIAASNHLDSTILVLPTDTLQVDITTDCGSTWNTIYKKWGTQLQTTAPIYDAFVPTASQWRTDSINVSNYEQNNEVRFRFRNINRGGNNIYLDNIKCTAKTIKNILRDKSLLIYPNPVHNKLVVQHYAVPTNLQSINIYNEQGKRVKSTSYHKNANTIETIQLGGLANAVYMIELLYTDKKVMERVVKTF